MNPEGLVLYPDLIVQYNRDSEQQTPDKARQVNLYDVLWLKRFVDKLEDKHSVLTEEVEEILLDSPLVRLMERGHVVGEDLYVAYGQRELCVQALTFFNEYLARFDPVASDPDL